MFLPRPSQFQVIALNVENDGGEFKASTGVELSEDWSLNAQVHQE